MIPRANGPLYEVKRISIRRDNIGTQKLIHVHAAHTHAKEDNRLETVQRRHDTMGRYILGSHVKVKVEKPFDTDILFPP
jgi:hypothetical protein